MSVKFHDVFKDCGFDIAGRIITFLDDSSCLLYLLRIFEGLDSYLRKNAHITRNVSFNISSSFFPEKLHKKLFFVTNISHDVSGKEEYSKWKVLMDCFPRLQRLKLRILESYDGDVLVDRLPIRQFKCTVEYVERETKIILQGNNKLQGIEIRNENDQGSQAKFYPKSHKNQFKNMQIIKLFYVKMLLDDNDYVLEQLHKLEYFESVFIGRFDVQFFRRLPCLSDVRLISKSDKREGKGEGDFNDFVFTNMPSIRKLHVEGYTNRDEITLGGREGTSLETLLLHNVRYVGLKDSFDRVPQLRLVHWFKNPLYGYDNDDVRRFYQTHIHLEEVNLQFKKHEYERTFPAPSSLPKLEYFTFNGNLEENISDLPNLISLSSHVVFDPKTNYPPIDCPFLTFLRIYCFKRINEMQEVYLDDHFFRSHPDIERLEIDLFTTPDFSEFPGVFSILTKDGDGDGSEEDEGENTEEDDEEDKKNGSSSGGDLSPVLREIIIGPRDDYHYLPEDDLSMCLMNFSIGPIPTLRTLEITETDVPDFFNCMDLPNLVSLKICFVKFGAFSKRSSSSSKPATPPDRRRRGKSSSEDEEQEKKKNKKKKDEKSAETFGREMEEGLLDCRFLRDLEIIDESVVPEFWSRLSSITWFRMDDSEVYGYTGETSWDRESIEIEITNSEFYVPGQKRKAVVEKCEAYEEIMDSMADHTPK